MEQKTTTKDLIKTFVGGIIAVAAVWGISQSEGISTIIRFSVFFLLWLVCIYATLFYKHPLDPVSYDNTWLVVGIKAILVVFWTIILYLAAFHGIGLQEGPGENV